MGSLTLKDRIITPSNLVKIRAGQERFTMKAARSDGADNLFFKVGEDTFAASARRMDLKGIRRGDTVEHNGRTGKVTMINDEVNTHQEGKAKLGISQWFLSVLISIPVTISYVLLGVLTGVLGSALSMFGALVAGIALGLAGVWGLVVSENMGLWAENKKVNTKALEKFAK